MKFKIPKGFKMNSPGLLPGGLMHCDILPTPKSNSEKPCCLTGKEVPLIWGFFDIRQMPDLRRSSADGHSE